jgi:hypothetical protein
MRFRLERRERDRLGEIADVDRLELRFRGNDRQEGQLGQPAKRLVSSSSGPNTSEGRMMVAPGRRP